MNSTTTMLPDLKLQFNIEHPSDEECYLFGYECALSEVSEEENPFSAGSYEAELWSEGWWAGFYNEAPLFSLDAQEAHQELNKEKAANEHQYQKRSVLSFFFEISGAIAASAIVGYQLLELVA
ncbi:MAG: transmission trait enhancer LetE [Legionella sp.]|nr:MAG: transmission trait enhancer LetE [Legionella sp.]PJD97991.1 MAG: transmission trait enhancer LetE [Legionella sp.]